MSRYKKFSPVPLIAAGVLLVAFIGVIVWATGQAKEPEPAFVPPVYVEEDPEPEPVWEPPPEVKPVRPPPKPKMTVAQAEAMLKKATVEWRAFTLDLCKKKKWKEQRAVAFLQKVTWNDRDPKKQHANGLESLQKMLGTQTEDPVELAEALEKEGKLGAFFDENWSRVDVEWKPEPEKAENVLEDAWKPNRIRWGFPLDTPIERLQEFKLVALTTSRTAWRSLAGGHIQALEIGDAEKESRFRKAIGETTKDQEKKMHAAFRVLLDLPDGSVREVCEAFVSRMREQGQEAFVQTLAANIASALSAAEKAD